MGLISKVSIGKCIFLLTGLKNILGSSAPQYSQSNVDGAKKHPTRQQNAKRLTLQTIEYVCIPYE